MPALFTHYEIGKEVINKVNSQLQKEISSNTCYYDMFNQGWDNLFYYLPHLKYYRVFARRAHKKDITLFFTNMFNYIKDNNLENNSELTNMVYGFINHYVVDKITHTYINSQVHILNRTHREIEASIDNIIRKNKTNYYYNEVIPRLKFNQELLDFIDYVFTNTYNEKNIGKVFNKSHNYSYYIYRYIFNLKKKKHIDTNVLFNNTNNNWNHPKRDNEEYHYSFLDLYESSIKVCTKLDELAYKVIHNKEDINAFIKLINKVDIKNMQELLS